MSVIFHVGSSYQRISKPVLVSRVAAKVETDATAYYVCCADAEKRDLGQIATPSLVGAPNRLEALCP